MIDSKRAKLINDWLRELYRDTVARSGVDPIVVLQEVLEYQEDPEYRETMRDCLLGLRDATPEQFNRWQAMARSPSGEAFRRWRSDHGVGAFTPSNLSNPDALELWKYFDFLSQPIEPLDPPPSSQDEVLV